jgi:hypothetical protein
MSELHNPCIFSQVPTETGLTLHYPSIEVKNIHDSSWGIAGRAVQQLGITNVPILIPCVSFMLMSTSTLIKILNTCPFQYLDSFTVGLTCFFLNVGIYSISKCIAKCTFNESLGLVFIRPEIVFQLSQNGIVEAYEEWLGCGYPGNSSKPISLRSQYGFTWSAKQNEIALKGSPHLLM